MWEIYRLRRGDVGDFPTAERKCAEFSYRRGRRFTKKIFAGKRGPVREIFYR